MAKKVLCVIRTSTKRQEIESQHTDMLGFLKGMYKEEEIEWLEVIGASARKANPQYLRMLETIKATILSTPTIKAVAFWHLNRLGRIESYINNMKEWFKENKIQVYVKNPNLTLLDANGKLDAGANISWGVFASLVAYDTEEMMEKFKRGKKANKENNKYNGGFITYGFKVDNQGHIVPDYDKLVIVKLLFQEYATGQYSIDKLFEELKSRGIRFSYSHISLLLSNPKYIEYVGEELFNKVQAIKRKNDLGINTKEYKHIHLCNKLIKCPYCGSNYIADSNRYVCFVSKHYKRVYKEKCEQAAAIKSDLLDLIVWDIAFLYNIYHLFHFDDTAKQELEKDKNIILQKINTCHNQLIDCTEKKNRVNELYIEMRIDKAKHTSKINEIDEEHKNISAEIENYNKEIKTIDNKISSLSKPNLKEQLQLISNDEGAITIDKKKQIVHKYIKKIQLSRIQYNGRKAIKIEITDFNGISLSFINDYYMRSKRDIDNVFEIRDGKELPYIEEINGRKAGSRTSFLIDNFKDFIETSIKTEELIKNNIVSDELKSCIIKLKELQAELKKLYSRYGTW